MPERGEVLYFKFIHQNGGFTCNLLKYPQAKDNPIWGCYEKSDTIVTTSDNVLLEFWFSRETSTINEEVFTIFYTSNHVTENQEFRIWTKESFEGRSTYNDISGKNCVTVAVGYKNPV